MEGLPSAFGLKLYLHNELVKILERVFDQLIVKFVRHSRDELKKRANEVIDSEVIKFVISSGECEFYKFVTQVKLRI